MGVFDKLKNALFEVEYVEVDEEPKKEKKEKHKKVKEEEPANEKPIAKKIVLPGKKEEKIKKIQEEELVDQNFEARPKDENIKDSNSSTFKFMDDSDFKVDEEPVIKSVEEVSEVELLEENKMYDDTPVTPTYEEEREVVTPEVVSAYKGVSPVMNESISSIDNNSYKPKERESRPYGVDPSYRVSIKEYGSYESNEDRDGFRPSPIISPIYGILDKNYKKEDVVAKKEVRITSNYTRRNMNVDDIRNKAYGRKNEEVTEPVKVEEDVKDEPVMVDLSDEKEKPEVKEITVGDAMEYFQDLGLEYNVDYVDASNKSGAVKKEEVEEKDTEPEVEEKSEEIPVVEEEPKKEKKATKKEEKKEEKVEEMEEEKPKTTETKPVEVKNESDEEVLDDDNLFDLIDSMYKEEK